MKSAVSLLLVIILGVSSIVCVNGQTAYSQRQQDEVVRVRTNEVKLDIVVKDKKGRSVKDLKAGDFEVYEDGVRQGVESFHFRNRESTPTNSSDPKAEKSEATSPVAPATPPNGGIPSVTALVFDRLSPEARALARKAGLAYVDEDMAGGNFTAVFGIDQALTTLQSFTDNSVLVKQAVERATSASTASHQSNAAKVREGVERSIALDQQMASNQSAVSAAGAARDSAGASAASEAIGSAAIEQKFIEMQTQMLEHYEQLDRDQQGFSTINSLLAVISPMQNLPGRKTIIFFSEGLALPASVQTKFPSVISAANKANVSIYAIDSAGLRIESGTAEAAREINSLVSSRMQQQGRGNDSGTSGPYTKSLERNEDLLRLDPRSGLGSLADQTGGFLIHDTNDLVAGLRRIDDDMHGYYMLTYVPKNQDYNGLFRQISVKLTRSNLEVQTRKGYYAVESIGQLPILDYEAPAIAAARDARRGPNPFPFRGAALSFPATSRAGLTLLIAEAPLSAFTFAKSNDNKSYRSDFSILALVKDQSEKVVQKLSHHYPFSGPIENLETAKKGDVLFYRETQLPPGKYTVELIAYDGSATKASVSASQVEVPAVDETKPRVSSVAVLKRAERLTPEEQKHDQPLHFGELLIYPNLGEPIPSSSTKQLAFFFAAWPAKGTTNPLKVTLEILQNNKLLGRTSGQMPAADEQGQIKYASAFPLHNFQPGVFDLKVIVSDGKNDVSRSTQFTVER